MALQRVRRGILTAVRVCFRPHEEFAKLSKRKFEEVIAEFFSLLIAASIVAFLVTMLLSLLKVGYLDITQIIDVNYGRSMNYFAGRATSIFFSYLLAVPLAIFLLTLIIRIFVRRKMIDLIATLAYAFSPVLLFSWIPTAFGGLVVWTVLLGVIGVRIGRHAAAAVRNTVNQRE